MDERKASRSANVARYQRVSTGSNSQFEPRRVEKWRRSTFPAQVTACARSPQRVPAPCNVDDARPPNPRWASADLSRGPAYKSRPGLSTRQGPNRGPGLRHTCRAVGVSRDRQKLRRLLSCLPASKPDSRFVLSAPLSVESLFLSFES